MAADLQQESLNISFPVTSLYEHIKIPIEEEDLPPQD